MKKLLIILIIFVSQRPIKAQWIDHTLEIYGSYGIASPIGSNSIADGEFVLPSFYNNFDQGSSLSIGATYKFRALISLGLEYNQTRLKYWSFTESSLFNDSEAFITSIGPVLIYHFDAKRNEITNRFRFFVQAVPSIIKVENTIQTSFLSGAPRVESDELKSFFLTFGLLLSPGISYSLNPLIDLQIRSNLSYSKAEGKLNNDSSIITFRNEIGIVIKLSKNKRFYLGE
jgi:hypothetical protein